MKRGPVLLGADKTYVIAEAACAHDGNMEYAKNMIDIAAAAGCDAVKFQAFIPRKIPNITKQEQEYLEKVQFEKSHFQELMKYLGDRMDFLLTPFDTDSVDLCVELGLEWIKVPSGRVTDEPFIQYIRSKYPPERIIVSSGMLDRYQILHLKRRLPKMIWLHCVTAYPAPEEQMNLHVLRKLMFDGISDHTLSTFVPALAVACGAKIVEKHFTLSRSLPGPDQRCSLEPMELMDMVHQIRWTEKVLGGGSKRIMPCEHKMQYRQVITDRSEAFGSQKTKSEGGNNEKTT